MLPVWVLFFVSLLASFCSSKKGEHTSEALWEAAEVDEPDQITSITRRNPLGDPFGLVFPLLSVPNNPFSFVSRAGVVFVVALAITAIRIFTSLESVLSKRRTVPLSTNQNRFS